VGIEDALVPAVVGKADWKKWWEGARRLMKKDGRFVIPTTKTAPYQVLDAPVAAKEAPTGDSLTARGLIPQLKAAVELLDHPAKVKAGGQEILEFIARLEDTLRKAPESQKLLTLKLHLVRDELAALAGQASSEDASLKQFILTHERLLPDLVNDLTASQQRRVLDGIEAAEPHTWAAAVAGLLRTGSARLLGTVRDFFEQKGHAELFADALRRCVRDQSLSSEGMVWLLRNRKGDFAHLIEPRLFNSVLACIERDQLGERRSMKLRDLVVSDRTLLTDIIAGGDMDAVRDVTRALMLTTVFDEMDKRSLLSRIIKLHPAMQELVTAGATRGRSAEAVKPSGGEGPLIVSWSSLERRKAELEELVNKKIPANTQEIAVARSYGDLRENAEFKFAKEHQRVLSRQRQELEADLLRAQGTDFSDADTTKVSIGTIVTVSDGAKDETYTILGAWDGDPSRHIVSYLTPIARALLNKTVGDPAAFTDEHGEPRQVTVKSIAAYKP
jgi:transcription elongation GreA/GreB family factor